MREVRRARAAKERHGGKVACDGGSGCHIRRLWIPFSAHPRLSPGLAGVGGGAAPQINRDKRALPNGISGSWDDSAAEIEPLPRRAMASPRESDPRFFTNPLRSPSRLRRRVEVLKSSAAFSRFVLHQVYSQLQVFVSSTSPHDHRVDGIKDTHGRIPSIFERFDRVRPFPSGNFETGRRAGVRHKKVIVGCMPLFFGLNKCLRTLRLRTAILA